MLDESALSLSSSLSEFVEGKFVYVLRVEGRVDTQKQADVSATL